jgi:hypothetical protein
MKLNIYIICLITCFISCISNVFGQKCCPYMNGIIIKPSSPTTKDDIFITTQITSPSLGTKISKSYFIKGDTVFLSSCYFAGLTGTPQIFLDTFDIGILKRGVYTIIFKAFLSSEISHCDSSVHNRMDSVLNVLELGSNSVHKESPIEINPNPFKNNLSIEGEEAEQVYILDFNGQIIRYKEFDKGANSLNIDLCSISNGLYIVQIVKKNGSVFRKKILKN